MTDIAVGRFRNLVFLHHCYRDQPEPVEYIDYGEDILDSESLTDAAYEFYLLMMGRLYAGDWCAHDRFEEDLAYTLRHGVYLPCVKRTVLTGYYDARNDGPAPVFAAIMDGVGNNPMMSVASLRRVAHFPRGVVPLVPGIKYKVMQFYRRRDDRHRRRVNFGETDVVTASDTYCTLAGERFVQAHESRIKSFNNPRNAAIARAWPALVTSLWADRRYLWQVRTTDHIVSSVETPLMLGVSPEHVKSLFYARSLPVTDTGRKRPILHWVRAHERRIQSGIDVDVRKHLRGITSFEMDGLSFEITSPTKGQEQTQ